MAVTLFERALDFIGGENWAIAGILDAVEIDVERNDVPLEGMVFADVDVGAHDGAGFAGGAEAEFGGGVGADAGEVDGHVAGAGDAIHAFVKGFVEDDANVGGGAEGREGEEECDEKQWEQGRTNGGGSRGKTSGETTTIRDRNRQTTPFGDSASGPLGIEPEGGRRVALNLAKHL